MTVDPQTVMVSGPVSIVGRISSVGVEVDVTGASGDLEGSAPITFFDANGNRFEITDNRLTTDPEMVSYKIHMLRGKTPVRLVQSFLLETLCGTLEGASSVGLICSFLLLPSMIRGEFSALGIFFWMLCLVLLVIAAVLVSNAKKIITKQ